jgi:hypothetical protein
MFFLLHANLTVKMVDPTVGDPVHDLVGR